MIFKNVYFLVHQQLQFSQEFSFAQFCEMALVFLPFSRRFLLTRTFGKMPDFKSAYCVDSQATSFSLNYPESATFNNASYVSSIITLANL